MKTDYEVSKQNKVRQLSEKAVYDKESVHAILDAGILAHDVLDGFYGGGG